MLSWKWLEPSKLRVLVVTRVWKLELSVMLLKLWQHLFTLREKYIQGDQSELWGRTLRMSKYFLETNKCYRILFCHQGLERKEPRMWAQEE